MSLLESWVGWLPQLFQGLLVSLQVAGMSLLVGLPIGCLLALATSSRRGFLRWPLVVLVEIGRGVPGLVVLSMVYYGLPSVGLTLSNYAAAVGGLAFTTAAYTSEVFRGGIQAVPRGEIEAASALGMTRGQTFRAVTFPRGVRFAIPGLVGFAVMLFQATSLTFTIALPELLARANSIGSSTFRYMEVFALAGLMYLAITLPLGWLTRRIERRLGRFDQATP